MKKLKSCVEKPKGVEFNLSPKYDSSSNLYASDDSKSSFKKNIPKQFSKSVVITGCKLRRMRYTNPDYNSNVNGLNFR
jgi:hypothetical protein